VVIEVKCIGFPGILYVDQKIMEGLDSRAWNFLMERFLHNKYGGYCITKPLYSTRCSNPNISQGAPS
jgi:hypothetical protein